MEQSPSSRPEKAPDSPSKPICQLTGRDGNVFAIIAAVCVRLRRSGMTEQSDEFQERALASKSYGDVLNLCSEYVEVR